MRGNYTITYHENDIMPARYAKALSYPAGLSVLRHLSSLKPFCFTKTANDLPITYYTVSEHLTELKNAGLVLGSIKQPEDHYCVNYEN
ncbi:MAG: helix-turn-helix transcriptional regulator [Bacteroidales bacterium]|jgi:DNA-binding transcriptional ArsR family regulator|nr:helix-turn-helix transcriptional regulator [Bacteroidales bacterium]